MTKSCPEYRLRLFLSVDLVGSTAFKARHNGPNAKLASPNPAWVGQIRHFYRDFPDKLNRAFEKVDKPANWSSAHAVPQIWKTIGDEIAFCCRVSCLSHLVVCVKAFADALEQYGRYLDAQEDISLDVKGYGWVAAFPFPNVTVQVFDPLGSKEPSATENWELPDEAIEIDADMRPSQFDFLGREIDSGFRTGKFCSADKLSMSVELAWLIAKYGDEPPMKGVEFSYAGRQELKGVLNDRPYPIVAIDVERSAARRKVRDRERDLLAIGKGLKADAVHHFLDSFIDDEGIVKPWLQKHSADSSIPNLPEEYRAFRQTWEAIDIEVTRRSKSERQAAEQDNQAGDSDELSEAVTAASHAMIERASKADLE